MITLALLAASATPVEAKFDQCVEMIDQGTQKAIDFASEWQIAGGGIPARQCLGLAYFAAGRWLPAMTAFQQAAQLAERMKEPRAAILWVLAGNAALSGNEPNKARIAFETALATGTLRGEKAGEVYLDRARALMALKDPRNARLSLDQAIRLVPADPLVWLLSANLSRKSGNLARAEADITEAMKRAPDDASVALEAGNIAILRKNPTAAKIAWQSAVKLAPQSEAGKAAAEALKQFEVPAKP